MRLQLPLVILAMGFALTACHQQVISPDSEVNNPFKYSKKSAVCQVGPVATQPDGSLKTTMNVRSDDGQCEFILQQSKPRGSYQTFGVTVVPEHGKAFLYNYNDHTYVRYTPTTAYAGSDKFTVNLIHQDGQTKTPLSVDVTVDNTGVTVAQPVTPAKATTTKASTRKKVTTKRKATTRKTTRRPTASKK